MYSDRNLYQEKSQLRGLHKLGRGPAFPGLDVIISKIYRPVCSDDIHRQCIGIGLGRANWKRLMLLFLFWGFFSKSVLGEHHTQKEYHADNEGGNQVGNVNLDGVEQPSL